MTDDAYHLERFVQAQTNVYDEVLTELHLGRKTSHWMWFVFPQLKGLGHSDMANYYGLQGIDEAAAYYRHPLLGKRLLECCQALLRHKHLSAAQIFGPTDSMKFRSCLTLFAQAVPQQIIFRQLIDQYFDGSDDALTLQVLQA